MGKLSPLHGGTDAGPEPWCDFSTNANPLGPCPCVYDRIREADLTEYPDPHYTRLRSKLADYHQVNPKRIVVGAGASELILRLIRGATGPVQVLGPTFSEYARCARIERRLLLEVCQPDAFLRLQKSQPGLGFVCWPNNPTGVRWSLDFVAEAAQNGPLVVDLAYAPLCPDGALARIEAAAEKAYRLYAPNKAFGLCGLRAAYVITPRAHHALDTLAPSWVLDRCGEAFLSASVDAPAQSWLARCRPTLASWRGALATALTEAGIEVHESPATFLLARVGDAPGTTARLRAVGLRVRDASSFGLSEWIRISCQPPEAQKLLLEQLAGNALLASPGVS